MSGTNRALYGENHHKGLYSSQGRMLYGVNAKEMVEEPAPPGSTYSRAIPQYSTRFASGWHTPYTVNLPSDGEDEHGNLTYPEGSRNDVYPEMRNLLAPFAWNYNSSSGWAFWDNPGGGKVRGGGGVCAHYYRFSQNYTTSTTHNYTLRYIRLTTDSSNKHFAGAGSLRLGLIPALYGSTIEAQLGTSWEWLPGIKSISLGTGAHTFVIPVYLPMLSAWIVTSYVDGLRPPSASGAIARVSYDTIQFWIEQSPK